MNTLLYLSFGSGRHQYEVGYALATLARFSKRQCVGHHGRIVLLTDTLEFFRGYPEMVEVVAVDAARIAEWTGDGGHFFRSRIKAMQWMMLQSGGKLLAVDGDTYFTGPPENLFRRIARGHTLMYEPECAFADAAISEYGRTGRVLDALKRINLHGRRSLSCSSRSMEWNAGVLGVCAEDASLLGDVLTVLDTLNPLLPGVWSTEQTSFSIVWGAATRLRPGCGHVYHYNAHPDRIPFAQRLPDLLAATARLPEAQRAKDLYAQRPRRSPRRTIKHYGKRFILACGMWDSVMKLKRQASLSSVVRGTKRVSVSS